MITADETRAAMERAGEHWAVPLMDFVDDFRRRRDRGAILQPFAGGDRRFAALLASVIETLCDEALIEPPHRVEEVPGLRDPWFVSGVESLKALAMVESPLRFRIRNILVLENFLSRV